MNAVLTSPGSARCTTARLIHFTGVPSLSHSTARSPSSPTARSPSPMPSFFATVGKSTSSQFVPLGGVYVVPGGMKCAATPKREDVGVGVGVGAGEGEDREASMLSDADRGVEAVARTGEWARVTAGAETLRLNG